MSLAETLEKQAGASVYGLRCNAGKLLAGMPETDAKVLQEALAGDLQSSVIVKALREEGYTISYDSLHRHRRRVCNCER